MSPLDALLRTGNAHVHVSHVNTSYGDPHWFKVVLVNGNPPAKHSAFGGNGKSEWNEQEQCIVWIPL